MTERISELLNEAVAGVEPAHPDPVGAVLRRRRAARRTSVLTAAVVCVGLTLGGAVAAQQLNHGPDTGVVPAAVPVPYIDGDSVVAGSVRLPIPDGWQVVTTYQPCVNPARAMVIWTAEVDRPLCRNAAVEIFHNPHTLPGGRIVHSDSEVIPGGIIIPRAQITLPGGEPGLLERDEGDPGRTPAGYYLDTTLKMPWSQSSIMFRLHRDDVGKMIASMRSAPVGAGTLALPRTAVVADFIVSDATGRVASNGFGRIRDRKAIDRVLELLREQDTVVPDPQACAGSAQGTAQLVMKPTEGVPFGTDPSPVPGPSPAPDPRDTTVVTIALGGDCQEAVSAHGGRVRFSDEALTELRTIFGIGAR
ncbi:hypothetical protein AB0G04_10555 [Actinoplanes sp. NPDC023801]|uniref:hypothetical protein n=1 Tax=Actinoplanes sp. NPDC023801 TaxID=3154595 RepID=UPI0033F5CA67